MEHICASKIYHRISLAIANTFLRRLLIALEPGIIPNKWTKPAKMPFQQVIVPEYVDVRVSPTFPFADGMY